MSADRISGELGEGIPLIQDRNIHGIDGACICPTDSQSDRSTADIGGGGCAGGISPVYPIVLGKTCSGGGYECDETD